MRHFGPPSENTINERTHKYTTSTIIKWLWKVWKGNRLQAFINVFLGILEVFVSLASVWATQRAMDIAAGMVGVCGSIHEQHYTLNALYWAVAIMGGFMIGGFFIRIFEIWVKAVLGIKAQNRMQQALLDHLLKAQWKGKESLHSGDVINRLEMDVKTVVLFLTETIPNTVSVSAMFIGSFVYLFSMDKILAVITVGILPVFIIFSKLYVKKMRALTRDVRSSDSEVQSLLQETIQNRMLIKTMESNDAVLDKLERTQGLLRRKVKKHTFFSLLSHFILDFGFAIGYIIAFLWAAVRMYHGTLTFGGMTAFLQLVNRIQMPARNIAQILPAYVSVLTAAERLLELEVSPTEEYGTPVRLAAPIGIKIDNITYEYSSKEGPVINKLNYNFSPGSCTAILGETGSGKTTLIRLLLALLKPQSGHIYLYNEKEKVELTSLARCNFVYVPQGNTLMSGSIRENLQLGRIDATDEDMYAALHTACADFVKDLPDGLDTSCNEKGVGLSEGQSQRITIARALLRERSIMLFDESTSALDPETEEQLLKNILSKNDRTVIFITHRPAVVKYCDQTLHISR